MNVLIHICTSFIIFINSIVKPSIIYLLISFISVFITVLINIGIYYNKNGIDKMSSDTIFSQLQNNIILSTILSTIICFLVGLSFIRKKPKKDIFETILWLLFALSIVIFVIILIEDSLQISILPRQFLYYPTYGLLVLVFILTMFAYTDLIEIKKIYEKQFFAIKNKFKKQSEYQGAPLKL